MGICPRRPATPRSEVEREVEDEMEEKEEEEVEEASQISTSYLYLGEDSSDE